MHAPALLQYWVLLQSVSTLQGTQLSPTQIWPPVQSAVVQQLPAAQAPAQQT
jgi:hypothetical protein